MLGACLLLIASLSALTIAASAQAASLVFVKPDGNVWLARPDGSHARSVTSDGSAANPYYSPSQSARGTIEAARGKGAGAQLYRLSRNGKRLSRPLRPGVPVVNPAISPDGSKVAFSTYTSGPPCYLFSGPTDVRRGLLTAYKPAISPCTLSAPDRSSGADPKHRDLPSFQGVSFSPDGNSLAYGYRGAVYVVRIGSLTSCSSMIARKVIKTGTSPSWGPAS